MSCSAVLCVCIAVWRCLSLVCPWRSIAMSCVTMELVSTPEARPERESPLIVIS
jgi:hypothetical protein